MEKSKVKDIISEVLTDILEGNDVRIKIDENTALMGANSVIDSLGLVTLIADVEGVLLDEDIEVSIFSEKAMSQKSSPFLNVASLNNYIMEQINNNDA
tara:strand:- start:35 stop:328 length:294 start_codon:yes stop_codon:yes gene_type:complete